MVESDCNAEDLGSIPGLGRSPGGGHGNPPQCSCLENPHGQRSLAGYTVHGVTQSMTERLSTAQHSVPRTHALQKKKPLNEKPTQLEGRPRSTRESLCAATKTQHCQKQRNKLNIYLMVYYHL